MKKKINWRKIGATLVLYLDDALLLAGCGCFVGAAWLRFGDAAALAVAGVCLTAWAWLIARSRRR